ncbi:MAG: alpha-isopropylmalate synthase regulatory domain-containing protein, partial [Desulfocapsaceae bacterium]
RELQPEELYRSFEEAYLNQHLPLDLHSFQVLKRHSDKKEKRSFAEVEAVVETDGIEREISATGNGPLDAFSNALKAQITGDWSLCSYNEHAIDTGSSAQAIAYIEIERSDGKRFWGAGIDTDIIIASVKALLSSLNRAA